MGLQPVTRLSAEPSGGARLIVVSNRLPLTLRKAEDGWSTEHSSGGLASAMNRLLRKGGGDWIGWAGYSNEQQQEERRAVLQEWAERDRCFAVEIPRISPKDFTRAMPTRHCGQCFAGAAAKMGEALLINPFDEERTPSTIARADAR